MGDSCCLGYKKENENLIKTKKQYGAIKIVAMSYSKKHSIQKYGVLEKDVGV